HTRSLSVLRQQRKIHMRSLLVLRQQGKIRPKLVSVKRNEEGERSEDFLFERSEFNVSASRTQSHACMSFAEAQPNFTFGVNLQRAEGAE
ncbi:MAG: hypothetical protein MR448_12995, partial [Parabacteroides sp.]|nr:hypothetical protein [Parabacteroides sp.]